MSTTTYVRVDRIVRHWQERREAPLVEAVPVRSTGPSGLTSDRLKPGQSSARGERRGRVAMPSLAAHLSGSRTTKHNAPATGCHPCVADAF